MESAETDGRVASYSPGKRELLRLLKERPGISLADIARALEVSKVAALRHLARLESDGLVGRSYLRAGVGRPRAHFELTEASRGLFPQAYSKLSVCALHFIEERLGRAAVVELLQQRAHEVADENRARVDAPTLVQRVEALARVREEGGYMAAVAGRRRSSVELREHNCPILAVASAFPEACEVERRMFEGLLRARVTTSHRVVAGDPVCRFLVRPKGATS